VKVEDVREELPKLEGHIILKLVRVRMDSALSVLSGRVKVTFPFDPRVLRKLGIGPDALGLRFWDGSGWRRVRSRVDAEGDTISGEGPPGLPGALLASTYEPYVQVGPSGPEDFQLRQNFPNPFNTSTTIEFSLPRIGSEASAKLEIFDVAGRRLNTLLDGEMPPGVYRVLWDGRDGSGRPLASGIYIYRLTYGPYRATKRMVYIK